VTSDLDVALALADAADEITLARFRAANLSIQTKPDRTEVTDADLAVESRLRELLAENRPDDSVIGEEFEDRMAGARHWIIDPIDGTANFLRGVPVWASLIALREAGGQVSVGVVSAPALGRRWWAQSGGGAYSRELDGSVRSLRVSGITQLGDASFSSSGLKMWNSVGRAQQLVKLSEQVWRTRGYGDFLSYMYLAEGSVDIVCEHDLKIHDIAALVPIITEAGGTISDLAGPLTADSSSVLASNGLLHGQTAELLADFSG
jgi:histidinol-phosphatase